MIRTILVVDDDHGGRETMAALLRAHDFVCCTARDGVEGLAACAAAPPDLIILDVEMPRLNGVETCRALRSYRPWASIPVIAISGRSDPVIMTEMFAAGCSSYLVKPCTLEGLLQAVERAAARPAA